MKENDKKSLKSRHHKIDTNTEFFRLCIIFVLFVAWLILLISLRDRIPLHTRIVSFFTSLPIQIILPTLFALCVGATVYLKYKGIDTTKWIVTPFMGAGVFAFLSAEALFIFTRMMTSIDTSIILLLVSYAVYMLFMLLIKLYYKK